MKRLTVLFSFLFPAVVFSQTVHSHRLARSLKFPDIPGYKTLKCDLHQHTVFSDGSVWPDIRVMEALMDGLDAISLTEHLEYQPHKDDIPHPDRNRSFEIATREAKDHDLIIIRGSEITRKMPPGHSNAVFIKDANKLLINDSIEVFREAKRQGAFTFWNHPNWVSQKPDGIAALTEVHKRLIREKLLDGIEVVNDITYSDEALAIALENNLTIMGTSDIHGLVDWRFEVPHGGHRPVTLVFARERTPESIHEGLLERRTVVYFKDLLIGRPAYLVPLLNACLQVDSLGYQAETSILEVRIRNLSSSPFTLQNKSGFTFHNTGDLIHVEPNEPVVLEIKMKNRIQEADLQFEVLNAIEGPALHPTIKMHIDTSK